MARPALWYSPNMAIPQGCKPPLGNPGSKITWKRLNRVSERFYQWWIKQLRVVSRQPATWSQVQTSPLAPALRLGLRPNSQLTRPSQGSHTKGKFGDTTLCTMASVGFPLGSAPCPHSCWEQCGAGRCAPILPCLHPLGSRAWLENTWV